MKLQEMKVEIETLKQELDRLIDLGAGFDEIYRVSVKLDKLIVGFYRLKLNESA